jgi:hypothetical protein
VIYDPVVRPGRCSVHEIYHIFRDIYTCDGIGGAEESGGESNDDNSARTEPSSNGSAAAQETMGVVGKELALSLLMPVENDVNADGDTGDDWGRNASCCAGGGVGVDRGEITSSGDGLGGGESGTGTSGSGGGVPSGGINDCGGWSECDLNGDIEVAGCNDRASNRRGFDRSVSSNVGVSAGCGLGNVAFEAIGDAETVTGDKTYNASRESMTSVAGMEPVTEDVTSGAGMEPVTGDVTSGAGMEPVTGDVTSGAGMEPVTGDVTSGAGMDPD